MKSNENIRLFRPIKARKPCKKYDNKRDFGKYKNKI